MESGEPTALNACAPSGSYSRRTVWYAFLAPTTGPVRISTVGSDFHGFASMDRPPGSVAAPNDLLVRLEARLERIRAA